MKWAVQLFFNAVCQQHLLFLVHAAHSTIAIDWDTESKKLFYDEQEAEVRALIAFK